MILTEPSAPAAARPAARRFSSKAATWASPVSTIRKASRVRPQYAGDVTASPLGSLTWKVSMAIPSPRVWIWAEMMFTPCEASVPAISEKSPGRSRVTTTRSDEPRSGWWNSSVTTDVLLSCWSMLRCSAIRCTPVVAR